MIPLHCAILFACDVGRGGGNLLLRPLPRHRGTSAELRGSPTLLLFLPTRHETRLQCRSPPPPFHTPKSPPLQPAAPYLLRPSGRLRLNICSSLRYDDSDGTQEDLQRKAENRLFYWCSVDGGKSYSCIKTQIVSSPPDSFICLATSGLKDLEHQV